MSIQINKTNSTKMMTQSLQMLPLARSPFNLLSSFTMFDKFSSIWSLTLSSILFCILTSLEKFWFSNRITSTVSPIAPIWASYAAIMFFCCYSSILLSRPCVPCKLPSLSLSIDFFSPISISEISTFLSEDPPAVALAPIVICIWLLWSLALARKSFAYLILLDLSF